MTEITRPMLSGVIKAQEGHLEKLVFPLLTSPKLDGIRCLVHPELGPVTRKFKPVPNNFIYALLNIPECTYLDGELLTYYHPRLGRGLTVKNFNGIQSDVMSHAGEPHFRFHVFDDFTDPTLAFAERLDKAADACYLNATVGLLSIVTHSLAKDVDQLNEIHERNLLDGYEGTMIRSLAGPYKSGRSTFNQGWLLKYKPIADAEGTIIGFEELMHNENPDLRDELGQAKRSSHKENLIPSGTLGAFILKTTWGDVRVGTGFSAAQRLAYWDERESLEGQTVTFTYQAHGMQDKPRFPVFKGFRYDV